jgi:hypothetical protein
MLAEREAEARRQEALKKALELDLDDDDEEDEKERRRKAKASLAKDVATQKGECAVIHTRRGKGDARRQLGLSAHPMC